MPKLAATVLALGLAASALAAQAPRADSTVYTTAAVTLRQQPNHHAATVARLAARTRVRMAACAKGWCEVGVSGLSGYLPQHTLSANPKRKGR
jgi:SH3-like domain-containing protein